MAIRSVSSSRNPASNRSLANGRLSLLGDNDIWGIFEDSLKFNGFNDIAEATLATGLPIDPGGVFSIEVWIRCQQSGGWSNQTIYGQGNSGNNTVSWGVGINNKRQVRIHLRDDSNVTQINQVVTSKVLTAFRIYQIIFTFNEGDVHIYIDNVEDQASIANSFDFTPGTYTFNRVALGALPRTTNNDVFNGQIGKVVLYPGIVLTESQRNELYTNGSLLSGSVAAWLMNEGSGATVIDSSGNGNDLTHTADWWTKTLGQRSSV